MLLMAFPVHSSAWQLMTRDKPALGNMASCTSGFLMSPFPSPVRVSNAVRPVSGSTSSFQGGDDSSVRMPRALRISLDRSDVVGDWGGRSEDGRFLTLPVPRSTAFH